MSVLWRVRLTPHRGGGGCEGPEGKLLLIPLSIPAGVAAVVILAGLWRDERQRCRGLCAACGYEVRYLGCCPECGLER